MSNIDQHNHCTDEGQASHTSVDSQKLRFMGSILHLTLKYTSN